MHFRVFYTLPVRDGVRNPFSPDFHRALGVLGSCLARASDLSDLSVPMAMQLVGLRCACNCFFHPPTRGVVAPCSGGTASGMAIAKCCTSLPVAYESMP